MAEFFADPINGDDANPGSPAEPVRTIHQATQLAGNSSDPIGRIILSEGVFATPDEIIPLMVRPGYSLEGAGSDRTEIRITGEVRRPDGSIGSYWNGNALMAGSAVRDLTIRADPPPGPRNPCQGIFALSVIHQGTVIENVNIFAPELPEDHGPGTIRDLRTGFGVGLYVNASDVICRNCRISHQATAYIVGARNTLIDRLRLENARISIAGDVQLRNSEIVWERVTLRGRLPGGPIISLWGGTPTFGPDNYVNVGSWLGLIDCWNGTRARIVGNTFIPYGFGPIRVRQGSVVEVIDNFIGAADIDIQLDAGANNLFERNTFFINSGSYSGGISVAAPTDFGGGPAGSAGGNRFGAVRLWEPEIWTLPRGGVINADNNLWPPGGPGSVATAGSGTILTTNNARTDSLTPDDGLRLWILSYRARIGP